MHKLSCLKEMWMSEVLFVKDKQIAESSRDQVQQSTTTICNDVQTYQLPNHVFFWPAGWINVWCKKVVISNIQYYIHLTHVGIIPSDTCSTHVMLIITADISTVGKYKCN